MPVLTRWSNISGRLTYSFRSFLSSWTICSVYISCNASGTTRLTLHDPCCYAAAQHTVTFERKPAFHWTHCPESKIHKRSNTHRSGPVWLRCQWLSANRICVRFIAMTRAIYIELHIPCVALGSRFWMFEFSYRLLTQCLFPLICVFPRVCSL